MEVSQDLEEVRQLLEQARRDNTRRLLSAELSRLEALRAAELAAPPAKASAAHRVYEKKLTEYAWDQSDKFVKFYVTLKNVQTVPQETVTCSFTDTSFSLRVVGLGDKNYTFSLSNLLKPIDVSASKFKVKLDSVLVMLSKTSPDRWSHVTVAEKQAEDAKSAKYKPSAPSGDGASDPTSGIMDLMKKMYDEGDDEMKRTIKKAWSESRDKQAAEPGML